METLAKEKINEIPDQEIIDNILAGRKNMFALLIRRYNARLYRIGMAIVNNDSEIEDLMQNAYIKAYENLAKFEGRSSFATWLTRIFINESLAHVKRKKRLLMMTVQNNDNENNNDRIQEKRTPANVMLNKELATALETALIALPEKYRLVFVMREMEDMSIAETVDALSLSESNVKVRLNRAKLMMRDKLTEYYKNDAVFHFHLTRCSRVVENVFAKLGITE